MLFSRMASSFEMIFLGRFLYGYNVGMFGRGVCLQPLFVSVFCLHLVFLHRAWLEHSPHVPWGEFSKETQRFHHSNRLNFHRIRKSRRSNNRHQVRTENVKTNRTEKKHLVHLYIKEAKLRVVHLQSFFPDLIKSFFSLLD